MLRKDNDTTERGSAMFFDNDRLKLRWNSWEQPRHFENGSKARWLMNINEHAKYYKSLSPFFLLLFFPRERLEASPRTYLPCLVRVVSICLFAYDKEWAQSLMVSRRSLK